MSGARPTDDLIPPAKKRMNDRQITKDDAEEESDAEEEIDPNNFEKASEDVLKTRKIVKARRGGGALASSAPPPATEGAGASNPFAGVSLVAPVAPPPTTTSDAKPSGFGALASSSGGFAGFAGGGFAAAASTGGGFGAAASAAASSAFSFAASSAAATTDAAAPPPAFSFTTAFAPDATNGTKAPEPAVRSVFGAPDGGADAAGAPAAAPAVTLPPPQAAKTGEEDEECVFAAEGMLYEFDASKTWRERGRGEMRVNVPKGGGGHARLVMRSKGNLRLLMNANLWPDMIVTKMEGGKAATFACINAATASGEGEDGDKDAAIPLTTWAVRIKPAERLDAFIACLEEHKGAVGEGGGDADVGEEQEAV